MERRDDAIDLFIIMKQCNLMIVFLEGASFTLQNGTTVLIVSKASTKVNFLLSFTCCFRVVSCSNCKYYLGCGMCNVAIMARHSNIGSENPDEKKVHIFEV